MSETNGRWWKQPSFSVADLMHAAIIVVPIVLALGGIYFKFKDVPGNVAAIQKQLRNVATKEQLQSAVTQGNAIHAGYDQRISGVERRLRMAGMPAYRPIVIYRHRPKDVDDPNDQPQWDWQSQ